MKRTVFIAGAFFLNVFKFAIPKRPPTPVARQLFVEENGMAVSRKVQVNLLGAKTE